jgi:hypothetical protein
LEKSPDWTYDAGDIMNMLGKVITASAAMALTLAPIAAQAAQQPVARTGAEVGESEELGGRTIWIVAAIALGLLVWGIIELSDDNEPESP